MQKIKSTLYIVTFLLGASGVAEASPLVTTGYFRIGYRNSSDNNQFKCYQLTGSPSKYRLGNECDNYAEFNATKAFSITDKKEIILIGGVSYGFSKVLNYKNLGGNNIPQAAIKFKNFIPFLPGSFIWIGKIYYPRYDVHMRDFYYWTVSDRSVGIGDINLGFAKLSASLLNYVEVNPQTYYQTPDWNSSVKHNVIDLRLMEIPFYKNMLINIGFNTVLKEKRIPINAQKGFSNSGNMVTAMLLYNARNFNNTTVFQYGTNLFTPQTTGHVSGFFTYSQGDFFRIINHGYWDVNDYFNFMHFLSYQNTKLDNGYGTRLLSLGGRGMINYTPYFSTVFEVGYDNVKADNVGKENKQIKLTLAQQFQRGHSIWSRPALRFYVTYAKWNDAWSYYSGQKSSQYEAQQPYLTPFGANGDKYGLSYGTQIEWWW